jgi:hypothetical protein
VIHSVSLSRSPHRNRVAEERRIATDKAHGINTFLETHAGNDSSAGWMRQYGSEPRIPLGARRTGPGQCHQCQPGSTDVLNDHTYRIPD